MQSNYKNIGQFVRQISTRNTDLSVIDLKGISINKEFMPSVANVNGTDLSKYRVVEKEQFAFNPMHVGRDEVLPISMLITDEKVIVSPAYVVFEIIDKNELAPEYLMMWCRRPEFDRNAWFTTDNSVRGGFNWEDFCEMELPVPSIEKQREIVKEYNTIVNRIKLNEQLNQKLEETAQAIYKQWFVDFEFPISEEYATSMNRLDLIGKPYKSNGGEMTYNEELEQEIPKGWGAKKIEDIANIVKGKSYTSEELAESNTALVTLKSFNKGGGYKIDGLKGFTGKYNIEQEIFLNDLVVAYTDVTQEAEVIGKPAIVMIKGAYKKLVASLDVGIIKPININLKGFLWQLLLSDSYKTYILGHVSGTTVLHLSKNGVQKYTFALPNDFVLNKFQINIDMIIIFLTLNSNEIQKLMEFKNILLSRMASKQPEAVA